MLKIKKRLKKYKIFEIIIFLFIACIFISILKLRSQINQKQEQLYNFEKDIINVQSENDEIRDILNSGNEKEYIEKIAREKLGFIHPSEKVYIDAFGN